MKIGILTLPLHTNYGGILQAWALQTTLERMGHDVTVINKDQDLRRSLFRQLLAFGNYLRKKYVLEKRNERYTSQSELNRERREREQNTQSFIDNYIHTYIVRNLEKDVPKCFDAFVVGSDQVWRHRYFIASYKCNIENAFLKFAEKDNIKRVAYAASFGTDEWDYSEKETKECSYLLRLFDAVSVREDTGVTLCKEKLGREDVQHLLDPTFLLTKEDYIQLVEKLRTPKSPGNMMCYILDNFEDKVDFINIIAKERSLTPFYSNSRVDDKRIPQKERIQPPLEKWLRGFMDAEFVVTDSFHACVFSIIFEKPFIVIGNKERGLSRFKSLLAMFGLDAHYLTKIEDYNPHCSYEIKTDVLNKQKELIRYSKSYLQEALK